MSLPKEPRQKMINIMYLVLTALLALNVSVEILNAFKTVKSSLEKSSQSIDNSNDKLFSELQAKFNDGKTHDKAAKYKPMADSAKAYCEKVYSHIDELKDTLMKASGYNPAKDKDDTVLNDGDIESPTRLFIEHDNGSKLLEELTDLKKKLIGIDPEITQEFSNKLPIDLSVPKSQSGNSENNWEYSYFHMTPTIAALTMLSKFQNDIKNSENQIVTYCDNQINAVALRFDQFKPLVSLSSNYLMPGQQLTAQVGVGAFSSASVPTISIEGQTLDATKGYAEKTFAVGGPGQAALHYHITYKDQNGKDNTIDESVPYTVGQPSGAAISLDKMNVFYIGLENPITIGSPTGMEKTSVVGNGCTVNGSGAHRTVTVTAPGDCSITVTPQGSTPLKMAFRIKRIPEPEFKVGAGKARMPSVEFKNQQFCRADMGPDFIYDVHYSVVSATVYFSGANFNNVVTTSINGPGLGNLQQYLQRCGPGSVVSFDNVKVTGPDGTRIIEGRSFALY